MSRMTYLYVFAAGVSIGAVTAWLYAKKKYERIAQEEIDSVKEAFLRHETNKDAAIVQAEMSKKYEDVLLQENYISCADVSSRTVEDDVDIDAPYVISPDEFGEACGYERISLTYYADGTLADDNDEVVDDIGIDFLPHFGEYEEDSVFVRNDQRQCDYEILRDHREYADVLESKPWIHRED